MSAQVFIPDSTLPFFYRLSEDKGKGKDKTSQSFLINY
jgi:hypothetical protein